MHRATWNHKKKHEFQRVGKAAYFVSCSLWWYCYFCDQHFESYVAILAVCSHSCQRLMFFVTKSNICLSYYYFFSKRQLNSIIFRHINNSFVLSNYYVVLPRPFLGELFPLISLLIQCVKFITRVYTLNFPGRPQLLSPQETMPCKVHFCLRESRITNPPPLSPLHVSWFFSFRFPAQNILFVTLYWSI